jgi:hypothetical protein
MGGGDQTSGGRRSETTGAQFDQRKRQAFGHTAPPLEAQPDPPHMTLTRHRRLQKQPPRRWSCACSLFGRSGLPDRPL